MKRLELRLKYRHYWKIRGKKQKKIFTYININTYIESALGKKRILGALLGE